ncbi:MAG: DUF2800 domain-containing protein, partial [Endozoicomonadaceae bacterium]|nr:DUF2800 domain-containing protein [Endozoicomonadaceae bacterium]
MTVRASSLPRLYHCPASAHISRGHSENSAFASRGSALHQLALYACLGCLPNRDIFCNMNGLTDEEYDLAVNSYKHAYKFAMIQLRDGAVLKRAELGKVKQYAETPLASSSLALTGTPDFVMVLKDKAVVVDYKFGYEPVPAPEHNYQLQAYALMVHEFYRVSEVIVFVVQPEAAVGALDEPKAFSNFDQIRAEISDIIEQSKTNDLSKLNVGIPQCSFCPGKIFCPAFNKEMDEIIELSGSDLQHCTNEQIFKILLMSRLLTRLKDTAKIEAIERDNTKKQVKGLYVFEPQFKKDIKKNMYGVVHNLLVNQHKLLSQGQFNSAVKLSLAELSSQFASQAVKDGRYTKAEGKDFLLKFLMD